VSSLALCLVALFSADVISEPALDNVSINYDER
jgi:hypothetical protein